MDVQVWTAACSVLLLTFLKSDFILWSRPFHYIDCNTHAHVRDSLSGQLAYPTGSSLWSTCMNSHTPCPPQWSWMTICRWVGVSAKSRASNGVLTYQRVKRLNALYSHTWQPEGYGQNSDIPLINSCTWHPSLPFTRDYWRTIRIFIAPTCTSSRSSWMTLQPGRKTLGRRVRKPINRWICALGTAL